VIAAPEATRAPRFAETWEVAHAFRAVPGEVQTVIWSPNGQRIAAEGTDTPDVTVWDPINGSSVTAFPGPNDEARPNCLAFSPDSRLVAAGYNPTTHVFDAATGEERHVLKGDRGVISAVAFDPSGCAIGVADINNTIILRDLSTGSVLVTIDATGWGHVTSLKITHTGVAKIEAEHDTLTKRAWFAPGDEPSICMGAPWQEQTQPEERVWPLTGDRELSAAEHNTALELRNTTDSSLIERWTTDRFKLATLQTSEHSRFMMIVDGAKLRVWSAEDGRELAELAPDTGAWVRDAKFSPDGTMIATGDSDGVVRVWRRAGGG